ncbi:MAG: ATP synthase F0 subunit B [Clostridiaceae bacterium]|nr:ATP synthase F0 subunit B [Clostridiaceae bacterium]
MKIPLNIDWQQILLHLLNFSVLSLGLYLLLYKPIKNFMEQKAGYYNKMDIDTKGKLKQAEDMEASYKERLEDLETTIENRRASAVQQIQQEINRLLENAQEQAAKIISDAQDAAQRERAKILEDTQQEIAHMAMAATEKLLAKSASDALDEFLFAVKEE